MLQKLGRSHKFAHLELDYWQEFSSHLPLFFVCLLLLLVVVVGGWGGEVNQETGAGALLSTARQARCERRRVSVRIFVKTCLWAAVCASRCNPSKRNPRIQNKLTKSQTQDPGFEVRQDMCPNSLLVMGWSADLLYVLEMV